MAQGQSGNIAGGYSTIFANNTAISVAETTTANHSTFLDDDPDRESVEQIEFWLTKVAMVVLSSLGLLANVVSLWVWQAQRSYNASTFLFKCLCLCDAVYLLACVVYSQLGRGTQADVITVLFVGDLAQLLSIHTTLLIAISRWIAVQYPLKARGLLTRRRVSISCVIVLLWCVAIESTDIAVWVLQLDLDLSLSTWSIKRIVGLVCPLLVLLLFNLSLLRTVKRQTKDRVGMCSVGRPDHGQQRNTREEQSRVDSEGFMLSTTTLSDERSRTIDGQHQLATTELGDDHEISTERICRLRQNGDNGFQNTGDCCREQSEQSTPQPNRQQTEHTSPQPSKTSPQARKTSPQPNRQQPEDTSPQPRKTSPQPRKTSPQPNRQQPEDTSPQPRKTSPQQTSCRNHQPTPHHQPQQQTNNTVSTQPHPQPAGHTTGDTGLHRVTATILCVSLCSFIAYPLGVTVQSLDLRSMGLSAAQRITLRHSAYLCQILNSGINIVFYLAYISRFRQMARGRIAQCKRLLSGCPWGPR